jgi:hypothetical protein
LDPMYGLIGSLGLTISSLIMSHMFV